MHSQALAMDKYRLVGERKSEINTSEDDKAAKDEVRITQQGKPRNYITYAMNLFVSRVMFHVLQIILDLSYRYEYRFKCRFRLSF